jgi:hypothetical protein
VYLPVVWNHDPAKEIRMSHHSVLVLSSIAVLSAASSMAGVGPLAHWPFDHMENGQTPDAVGNHPGVLSGQAALADGVVGKSFRFNTLAYGPSQDRVTVADAPELSFPAGQFSLAAWVNPYVSRRGQQMIVAKNDYAENQRQWGLMIDQDDTFAFYLWNQGWQTLRSTTKPIPGQWYHVAVTFDRGQVRLYINGKLEGEARFAPLPPSGSAPVTIGGVVSGKSMMQGFVGALDEVMVFAQPLVPAAIQQLADFQPAPHIPVLDPAGGYELWQGKPVPNTADLPVLPEVKFHVIKPYQFAVDGYRFHHGVALAWHRGRLYASVGMNRYGENLGGEEALGLVSEDGGNTWSDLFVIESGRREDNTSVSHGVFLSHDSGLWAFHGAFGRDMSDGMHTRIYLLDETTGKWLFKGRVLDGFWPLQEPLRMADGNWIMAGLRVGDGNPAAVAISHDNDLTRWELVVIPKAPGQMWGESSVILDGRRAMNIARYDSNSRLVALVATSEDCGRTWTASQPSNLPMAATKPYTGTLSTGHHYLISTTTGDCGNRRAPLTIALSQPGERTFSKIWVIRHAEHAAGNTESHPSAALSYPYAVEHEGKLYVGYSNSGGGVGRVGEGRERWNNNSIELAVIPLTSLLGKE